MTKRESKVMRSFQIKMMTQLAQGKFQSVDLKNDLFVKWLVGYLAETRVPFKLVPLGGGVTRILHSGGLCPLCSGSGIIHGDEPMHSESPDPSSIFPDEQAHTCCGGGSCGENDSCCGGSCCSKKRQAA